MNGRQTGQNRIFYVVAAVLMAGGVALFVAWLYSGLADLAGSMTRIKAPGDADITLSEPGGYLIFHEYKSVLDGEYYLSGGALAGMRFSLSEKSSGREIKLSPPTGRSTYSMGERAGESVLAFDIDHAGVYTFSSWRENGSDKPEAVLAIGSGFTGKLVMTILGGLGILFATVIGAVLMFALATHKRRAGPPGGEGAGRDDGPRPIHPGW